MNFRLMASIFFLAIILTLAACSAMVHKGNEENTPAASSLGLITETIETAPAGPAFNSEMRHTSSVPEEILNFNVLDINYDCAFKLPVIIPAEHNWWMNEETAYDASGEITQHFDYFWDKKTNTVTRKSLDGTVYPVKLTTAAYLMRTGTLKDTVTDTIDTNGHLKERLIESEALGYTENLYFYYDSNDKLYASVTYTTYAKPYSDGTVQPPDIELTVLDSVGTNIGSGCADSEFYLSFHENGTLDYLAFHMNNNTKQNYCVTSYDTNSRNKWVAYYNQDGELINYWTFKYEDIARNNKDSG